MKKQIPMILTILIALAGIIFILVAGASGEDEERTVSCDYFANTPAHEIPARCLSFYNNQSHE